MIGCKMIQKFKTLERKQMMQRLEWLSANQSTLARPREGWIRTMRKLLGMSAPQVAKRLGVSQPRIIELEKGELSDNTTLKAMRAAAEAMNCRFEYSFIPQVPVDQYLKERAYEVARARVAYVSYHMELEKQGISQKEKKEQIEQIVDELLKNPKKIWSSNEVSLS